MILKILLFSKLLPNHYNRNRLDWSNYEFYPKIYTCFAKYS